jgi:glycosyltransferase involved in cell wall biosynthesis
MAKVLLVGYNPPQLLQEAKIEAAHYRTWQFLQPLLDDGHTICLCGGARGEPTATAAIPESWQHQLEYVPVPFGQRGWPRVLQDAHDRFDPDCIVAVNFSHCLYTTKLRTAKPVWMDIYGDMLTIIQASLHRAQSDRGLTTSIGFMDAVLRFGDVFSGCGVPQAQMLVGELAMAGRLNRRTFGYEFTRVIRPGSPPNGESRNGGRPASRQERPFLRQFGLTGADVVVLWCGGYNTWTDVDTLFRALEFAMKAEPAVHYLSVGANTYSAPDNVYVQLQKAIEGSPMRARFHMLGWRPWAEMGRFYSESDIGINIDALHYETLFGTRTRLVEMMGAGLPIVTSLGCELSYLLRDHAAALTFEIGDWQRLGQHIIDVACHAQRRHDLAARAMDYASQDLSFAATTMPLRSWVKSPLPAPDKGSMSQAERTRRVEYTLRAKARHLMWHMAGLDQ